MWEKRPALVSEVFCVSREMIQGPASVRPGPKLQFAVLHIKGKPAYIDVAGTLEYACVGDGNRRLKRKLAEMC
ncbi:hypothetical protein CK820_G0049776 [Pan troglodytes]|uniref:Uncharacterized protein n=1 Tax=Pan troglodytes TaxID=9598 RepID=A0A2J8J8Y2_PANTR|nr:hypothetical protein CK820_G0049776 [Pan troglodytes]